MEIADIILAVCLLFYFIRGWSRGIWGTIIGPLAFIVGTLLGILYYLYSHNFLISLLIAIIAPFVIDFILSLILGLIKDTSPRKPPFISLGRILGAALSSVWGILIITLWVVMLMYLPEEWPGVKTIQDHLRQAQSYSLFRNFVKNKVPEAASDFKQITTALSDPKQVQRLQSTKEYQDFMADPNIQAFLNDEETLAQAQNKDYWKMMTNKKLYELLNDKAVLEKFKKLQKRISELAITSSASTP